MLHFATYNLVKYTYCSTNNSTKRIPRSFIEPVKEIVEPMSDHVMSRTVVKPKKHSNAHV